MLERSINVVEKMIFWIFYRTYTIRQEHINKSQDKLVKQIRQNVKVIYMKAERCIALLYQ